MKNTCTALGILACSVLFGSAAWSGNNNVIVIEQSGSGNQLNADQTLASNSLIAGDGGLSESGLLTDPAVQSGANNVADVTISADGGTVFLLQENAAIGAAATGNAAAIALSALNAEGVVEQNGDGNYASINVSGELSNAAILQNGNRNTGGLSVSSQSTDAQLVQNGNNISTDLSVTGAAGGAVTYTVNGNNIVQAGGPLVVNTNGATVTITQTR